MPVRRIPGSHGRVFAESAELDAWKLAQNPAEVDAGTRIDKRIVALAVVGVVTLAVLGMTLAATRGPASWRYHGSTLVVEDESGREVWRKAFEEPVDTTYQVYRRERAWVGDLDGDGRKETLFVHAPWRNSTQLVAFSAEGKELWRFEPGKTVVTKKNTYAPPYVIQQFLVTADGNVLITSCHYMYHPNQVVLLDLKGKIQREYWHSGRLGTVEIADMDEDGEQEIYLGGVSQGYKMATVVRLDAASFGGASVEEDAMYQMQGFAEGYGSKRILLPRSCINRELEQYNVVFSVHTSREGLVVDVHERPSLTPGSSTQFELDGLLGLRRFHYSDTYQAQHRLMVAQGMHRHELESDAGEMKHLRILDR